MKKLSIKKIRLANMTDLDKLAIKGGNGIISMFTPKCAINSWSNCPSSNSCGPAGTVNGCGTPTGCSNCVTCPCEDTLL